MIHEVGAPDDPRIAAYAHVGDHAWLRARELFVAEGRLVVERLLASRRYVIDSVLLTAAALDALRARLEPIDADVYVAPQAVLDAVTGFNFHRGCLALARRPESPRVDAFTEARRLLILEGVGNPDNVGGLFRVAAALGADGVLLDPGSGDPLYRKALRTSMGAVLRVPFARLTGWPAELRALTDAGVQLLALTPDPSAPALADIPEPARRSRIALMLGAEGAGLSERALAAAHVRVRIPMAPGVDSLNVSVAAAVALYALR